MYPGPRARTPRTRHSRLPVGGGADDDDYANRVHKQRYIPVRGSSDGLVCFYVFRTRIAPIATRTGTRKVKYIIPSPWVVQDDFLTVMLTPHLFGGKNA